MVAAKHVSGPGESLYKNMLLKFSYKSAQKIIALDKFFLGHQFVVMDLPLLFESGSMLDFLYKIIVVSW